jgi:hypothetical protein
MWKYAICLPLITLALWFILKKEANAPVPEMNSGEGAAATTAPPVLGAATSGPETLPENRRSGTDGAERTDGNKATIGPAASTEPSAGTTTVPAWSGQESDLGLFPRAREFAEDFYPAATVAEAGTVQESAHADWALTSGAYFYLKDGLGATISGSLPADDPWRKLYARENPEDTDNGLHPQNIFRLALLKRFLNLEQQAYFRVQRDNLSASQFRNGSNGLLFFNRYQDADNLYYTGIRVDGYATIKKKKAGEYHTLAYERFLPGEYNREKSPNLLPKDIWLGLRSVVTDGPDGKVSIKLYWDKGRVGKWEPVAEAVDDGKSYGGAALRESGLAGIRTDFMDVEFADYRIKEIGGQVP